MKYAMIALIIFASSALYSQQRQPARTNYFDEVTFLDTLGKKSIATVGDALTLFSLAIEKKQPSVTAGQENDAPLKKGFIAYMIADELKMNDSLFFRIFKSKRYAFRVCVAEKLMNPNGSENDLMNGEELIEFLRLASEYKEKGAEK